MSSLAQAQRHKGLDKYLKSVLHDARIADAELLAYYTNINTLWVKLPKEYVYSSPASVTSPMDEATPYTIWVDYDEAWDRKDNEMYSYTHVNKRKKRLTITDVFSYGKENVARINILQTNTKRAQKLGLAEGAYLNYNTCSIKNIEMIANWVDCHREASINDYRMGTSNVDSAHDISIVKTDSCYPTPKTFSQSTKNAPLRGH